MTRPSLAGIEQRTAAAIEGPWFEDDDGGISTEPTVLSMTSEPIVDTEGCGMHEGNRALIAHAHTDLPALTAVVRDVLALHQGDWSCGNPAHTNPDVGCPECGEYCADCGQTWPCATARALAARLDLTDPEGDPT